MTDEGQVPGDDPRAPTLTGRNAADAPLSATSSELIAEHAELDKIDLAARRSPTLGWLGKIVGLGLADALAVAGLFIAIDAKAWGYAAVLGVTLVALNVVYLPRRLVPAKYLLPGLFFLAVFGIYPVLYTAYAGTTNYGTGHVLSEAQAIERIQSSSVRPVEGATRYDITPLAGEDGAFAGFGLYDPATETVFLGTLDSLEELDDEAQLTTLATTGRTFIESVGPYTGVRPGQVRSLPGYPDVETYVMPGTDEDTPLSISGGQAVESTSTRVYDSDAGTITDTATGVVYSEDNGRFVAEDGSSLSPGFVSNVGFSNFREVFTSSAYRGPFVRVLAWNLAFAVLSVGITFIVGLLLAITLNEKRMRGRKIYRSLVIIPYALPGFMTALVWVALLNRSYGVNKWLHLDVGWLTNPWLAMGSLILVNLWLGYPYMFLVCTGALQSIPTELTEAAKMDGASGPMTFRKITFPLLLTSVSPLLVGSFAFNFNNFTLIYLVTQGGPRGTGETAGSTDILLSWVYRIALDAGQQRQGLAAALSLVIFFIVAGLSAIGFKYTKTFEEAR